MKLDLNRLHNVALGELQGRGCGKTTLYLAQVIHAVWEGEQRLVSIPIQNVDGAHRWGIQLIDYLRDVCDAMGAAYQRISIGEALVEGVNVRVYVGDTSGIGNCSEVKEEVPFLLEHVEEYCPFDISFLNYDTLSGSFFKSPFITTPQPFESLHDQVYNASRGHF